MNSMNNDNQIHNKNSQNEWKKNKNIHQEEYFTSFQVINPSNPLKYQIVFSFATLANTKFTF